MGPEQTFLIVLMFAWSETGHVYTQVCALHFKLCSLPIVLEDATGLRHADTMPEQQTGGAMASSRLAPIWGM